MRNVGVLSDDTGSADSPFDMFTEGLFEDFSSDDGASPNSGVQDQDREAE